MFRDITCVETIKKRSEGTIKLSGYGHKCRFNKDVECYE